MNFRSTEKSQKIRSSDKILIKTFDQVKNDNFDQVKFDQVIICRFNVQSLSLIKAVYCQDSNSDFTFFAYLKVPFL